MSTGRFCFGGCKNVAQVKTNLLAMSDEDSERRTTNGWGLWGILGNPPNGMLLAEGLPSKAARNGRSSGKLNAISAWDRV